MQNVITFVPQQAGHFQIGHNRELMFDGIIEKDFQLLIPQCQDHNCFWVRNKQTHDVAIDRVMMFDHGEQELKHHGIFQSDHGQQWCSAVLHAGGVWTLSYDFPTFAWLHKVLHYGWYNKPWNYRNLAKQG